jgi:hypothetical protein
MFVIIFYPSFFIFEVGDIEYLIKALEKLFTIREEE